MVKIIWSRRAFAQFERIIKYIRNDQGLTYARIVHSKILQSVSFLQDHPELGPKEPLLAHKKSEYRFIVIWSFKIIYKIEKDKVVISRVFHTSQNPKKLRGV